MGNLTFAETYEAEWSAYYWPILEVTGLRTPETTRALRLVAEEHKSVTPELLPARDLLIETEAKLQHELQRVKKLEAFVTGALAQNEIDGVPLSDEHRKSLKLVRDELLERNGGSVEALNGLTRAERIERWIASVTPASEPFLRFMGAYDQLHGQTAIECLENAKFLGGLESYADELTARMDSQREINLALDERLGISRAWLVNRLLEGSCDIAFVRDFELFFRELLPLDWEDTREFGGRYRPMAYQLKFYRAFIDAMLDELDMIVINAEVELL